MSMEQIPTNESITADFEVLSGVERPQSPLSRALTEDAMSRAIAELSNEHTT